MQIRVIGNGRYRLEKRLGQGGFGTTWLAADQENQAKGRSKRAMSSTGRKKRKRNPKLPAGGKSDGLSARGERNCKGSELL